MKTHKAIQIFIQFCLIFFAVEVFAGFGDMCPLASFETDDYLKQNTAYGHIMYSIDMTNPLAPDACDPSDTKFKFCLKIKKGVLKNVQLLLLI